MSDLTDEELLDIYAEDGHWTTREMANELLTHRATMKRLEELALSCEHNSAPAVRHIAVEIRVRIKGTAAPECLYGNMPREAGAGHWREWHRGHGCHLDPTVRRGA